MKILVFSDNPSIRTCFSEIEKSKSWETEFYALEKLKCVIGKAPHGSVFYVDVESADKTGFSQILKYLSRHREYHYGIIDRLKKIDDVGEIFHNGASDYISGKELAQGISVKRLKRLKDFIRFDFESKETANLNIKNLIPSGKSWDHIRSGKEYTFFMLYISMDKQGELLRDLGADHFKHISENFKKYMEHQCVTERGRIWIWDNNCGTVLFPFDGSDFFPLVLCVRIILHWRIAIIEGFRFNLPITFRMVLHIGNSIYRSRGETGSIISESLNSLYHIGENFASGNSFYVTEEAAPCIPQKLREYFISVGDFEEREILVMKHLH